jgi:hypothetical protein
MLTSSVDPVTNQTTSSLILLRGPFVAPQELGTATAPVLNGSSTTTITHGSGNTMLTLTGTNFPPGVAVTWKGSHRTTTIVERNACDRGDSGKRCRKRGLGVAGCREPRFSGGQTR